jgi:O-methyltransferase involved in polyketide biosynthesis
MLTGISDVASTSFITLYCHALDTLSDNPILPDPKSVEIITELNKTLSRSDRRFDRTLVAGTLNRRRVVHIAIRAKKYNEYVRNFLRNFPDGVVVNIGCGFDSRFLRTDNGRVVFYDLDLPEILAIKKSFFKETERYHLIATSVLDFDWMAAVRQHNGPFLFMAEGVFMYLDGNDILSLVVKLKETFSGSEVVCEVVNSRWLRSPLKKSWITHWSGRYIWERMPCSGPVSVAAGRWNTGITEYSSLTIGVTLIQRKRNWDGSEY